jgi:hypothetical protein
MRKVTWLLIYLACAGAAAAYTVHVSAADVTVVALEGREARGFQAVEIPDGVLLTARPGEPSLPGVVVNVALPPGTKLEEVIVDAGEPRELAGTYRLLPFQPPLPVGEKPGTFVPPDPAAYEAAAPFPANLVQGFASANVSGYTIGSILLAPVQYVPATGKVLVYEDLSFDVITSGATSELVYPERRLDWVDGRLRTELGAMVCNPGELVAAPGIRLVHATESLAADDYPYLIITDSYLVTEAQKLVTWKTKKGLRAKMLDTDYVAANYSGTDTAERIRNCIKDYYQNHATQYVLLMGTFATIPMRKCYDPGFQVQEGDALVPTDNYYGCLDGNFNANGNGYWGEYPGDDPDFGFEVFVGRVQTNLAGTVTEVVDKTLCYEGSRDATETNPYNYQTGVILGGAFLDSSTNERYLMEYVRDNHFTAPGWSFTELWDPTYPGGGVFNAAAFIGAMNAGRGIIAHAAHSNTTLIGTNSGGVNASDLAALTNHPKFSGVLYSLGCYAGNTDTLGNCSASFVNAANGGGVGFCGNTRYGWYSPGSPVNGYSADFLKSYFNQLGVAGVFVSGETCAYHKMALNGTIGDWTHRYISYELYHCGDPDIWFPTAAIGTLAVDYSSAIGIGTQTYNVNVDSGTAPISAALVCLWKGEEVYATGVTDEGGLVSFNINPTTSGTMYLTVSAHNYKAFEGDVTVGGTGIALAAFGGRRTPEGVALGWRTCGAFDGSFNLYRRPWGDAAARVTAGAQGDSDTAVRPKLEGWTKVNAEPIKGWNPYTYFDAAGVRGGCDYALEAVEDTGATVLGTTSIGGATPAAFGLKVMPNPARDHATLRIGLAEGGDVNVAVFDLTGRKVMTVTERSLAAGEYTATLDVGTMPEGVYVIRLAAGTHAAAVRLAVVH